MSWRRSLPTLSLAAILLVATALVLGKPDGALAWQFLSGGYPSDQAAFAVIAFAVWAIVLVVALVAVGGTLRQVRDVQVSLRTWPRAIMFLTMGVIVLGMGVWRHNNVGYSMNCGNCPQRITEATQLANAH